MKFKTKSSDAAPDVSAAAPWRVLLVDDEPEVHTISRLALGDFEFEGRPVECLTAASAAEARRLLRDTSDIALAYVDVVMETDSAGLDFVNHVRKELGNQAMRIVLRTGQPGMAPERQVIRDYDISDYLSKTRATADKLYTTTLTALRAYAGIRQLEESRSHIIALSTMKLRTSWRP